MASTENDLITSFAVCFCNFTRKKYFGKFINNNRLCVGIFQWQQSCSAFSISKRSIPDVCDYIDNQKEHHKTETYDEEHEKFVKHYQQTIRKKTKE